MQVIPGPVTVEPLRSLEEIVHGKLITFFKEMAGTMSDIRSPILFVEVFVIKRLQNGDLTSWKWIHPKFPSNNGFLLNVTDAETASHELLKRIKDIARIRRKATELGTQNQLHSTRSNHGDWTRDTCRSGNNGHHDLTAMMIEFLPPGVGLLSMMLANRFWLPLVTTAFFSLANSLVSPAVSALTSKRTNLDQGITMGLNNAFGSLGRIFSPPIGGLVFDLDWRLPFIGAAMLMASGFLVGFRVDSETDYE